MNSSCNNSKTLSQNELNTLQQPSADIEIDSAGLKNPEMVRKSSIESPELTKITIEPKNKIKPRVNFALEDLHDLGILGRGAFGIVSLKLHKESDTTYALKSINKNRVVENGQEKQVLKSKAIMAALDSPFCVHLYATYQVQSDIKTFLRQKNQKNEPRKQKTKNKK